MDLKEAEVQRIPRRTKTEELDDYKDEIKDFFEGDDLSGLTLSGRRSRKTSYADIDQYLQSNDFQFDDRPEENEIDYSLGGAFKLNYKFKLSEETEEIEERKIELEQLGKIKMKKSDSMSSKDIKKEREIGWVSNPMAILSFCIESYTSNPDSIPYSVVAGDLIYTDRSLEGKYFKINGGMIKPQISCFEGLSQILSRLLLERKVLEAGAF